VEFLDSRIVQILIHPAMAAGRLGFRIFQRGARKVLQLIERVSGIGFLEDISEFLMAFEHMSEGFRDRAVRVRALLLGPEASFILIAGPAHETALYGEQLHDHLEATRVPLAAVLINRVHHWPGGGGDPPVIADPPEDADIAALAAALTRCEGADYPAVEAARAATAAATGYAQRVRSDARSTESLQRRTEHMGRYWGTIPELADDIHDLEGLGRVADLIFERGADGKA
jgi:anion-transporting  ArsA/GET3 family ATPase